MSWTFARGSSACYEAGPSPVRAVPLRAPMALLCLRPRRPSSSPAPAGATTTYHFTSGTGRRFCYDQCPCGATPRIIPELLTSRCRRREVGCGVRETPGQGNRARQLYFSPGGQAEIAECRTERTAGPWSARSRRSTANEAVKPRSHLRVDEIGAIPPDHALVDNGPAGRIERASEGWYDILGYCAARGIQMQSEGGAVVPCTGPVDGRTTTTFTASQGLLLMIPTFPDCRRADDHFFDVAARALAAQALLIFGVSPRRHGRVYDRLGHALRQFRGGSDDALIAQNAALASRILFIGLLDGLRDARRGRRG